MSCGLIGPSVSGVAGAHALAFLHVDVHALRDQVLALLAVVALDDDLAHALDDLAELDHAVDLGDDRRLLRAAAPRTARRRAADRR